ncbi:cytoplasmic protein [Mesorhizobium sp. CAU 1732]|uniref:cytoplasmic protein n=1 Tax=Mesorhizobium sp. CAU 1732 TaxID=3140358 RepID=UPI00326196C2
MGIREEAHQFRLRKNDETHRAGETAALFVLGRIDRDAALSASGEDAKRVRVKLERLIERERLRGMRRHWSYDLNRHIALKQALDRIKASSNP